MVLPTKNNYIQLTFHTCSLVVDADLVCAIRIMGKYVRAAQDRVAGMPVSGDDQQTDQGSRCPFHQTMAALGRQRHLKAMDDGAPVLDVLSHDSRVSSELAINLVMAIFRTGIDSVSGRLSGHFIHGLFSYV